MLREYEKPSPLARGRLGIVFQERRRSLEPEIRGKRKASKSKIGTVD